MHNCHNSVMVLLTAVLAVAPVKNEQLKNANHFEIGSSGVIMKIGVIVERFGMPLRKGIAVAAEIGCCGVQIYGMNQEFNLLERSKEEIRDLRKFTEDKGLCFSAVCSDMPGLGFENAAEVPNRLEKLRKLTDMVLELDCHILTNHIGIVEPEHKFYPVMVDSVRRAAEYAASCNVAIGIESGPETAEILKQFIKEVDSPGLGINLDPANLKMVQDADPAAAVHTLGGHIIHTHAKDGLHLQKCNSREVYTAFAEGGFEALVARTGELFREVPLGEGQVNWPEYIQALKDIKYDGFLTIEREVGEDPIADIVKAVTFLKHFI